MTGYFVLIFEIVIPLKLEGKSVSFSAKSTASFTIPITH